MISLLKSAKKDSDRKNAAEDLKRIVDNEQMPKLITSLKGCFLPEIDDINSEKSKKYKHYYKLLWYCAEKMNYSDFYRAWNSKR
ncbi:MAG: hypothetical protein MJK14_25840 [Rivularia sp. ALOHA_DT_140]|nr:hypothetical protein [Rivularia sp. ALOHA_DT_140]